MIPLFDAVVAGLTQAQPLAPAPVDTPVLPTDQFDTVSEVSADEVVAMRGRTLAEDSTTSSSPSGVHWSATSPEAPI